MASAGLSGLARGLAASPLGNLPALMAARDEMKMKKEEFQAWKQDRQEAKDEAANRQAILEESTNYTGPDRVDFLANKGLFEEADALAGIYQGRTGLGIDQQKVDETNRSNMAIEGLRGAELEETNRANQADEAIKREQAANEYTLGLLDYDVKDRNTAVTERESEQEMSQANTLFKEGQTEKAEISLSEAYINQGFTPENFGTEEYGAYVDMMVRESGSIMAPKLGLPKDRILVGAQQITDENGEVRLSPLVFNKKTKTVGPMTMKGTSKGDDVVYSMSAGQFHEMMTATGTPPQESKHAPKGSRQQMVDGVPVIVNQDTGQTSFAGGLSNTEGQTRQAVNRFTENSNAIYAGPEMLPIGTFKKKEILNMVGPDLIRKGVSEEGLPGKIVTLAESPEIKRLFEDGSPESVNEAIRMIQNALLPRQGSSLEDASNPAGEDPRSKMPLRAGGTEPAPEYVRALDRY